MDRLIDALAVASVLALLIVTLAAYRRTNNGGLLLFVGAVLIGRRLLEWTVAWLLFDATEFTGAYREPLQPLLDGRLTAEHFDVLSFALYMVLLAGSVVLVAGGARFRS